jgi:hypothetical protein
VLIVTDQTYLQLIILTVITMTSTYSLSVRASVLIAWFSSQVHEFILTSFAVRTGNSTYLRNFSCVLCMCMSHINIRSILKYKKTINVCLFFDVYCPNSFERASKNRTQLSSSWRIIVPEFQTAPSQFSTFSSITPFSHSHRHNMQMILLLIIIISDEYSLL